ncbi:MAG: glutamate racemase [Nannocystaceae bacterium]
MTSEDMRDLPIGVFDSGVGGLTVLRELEVRLPGERFIYLGDTARLPYGTKGPQTVMRYAEQVARVLIRREIKLLVIACNTATAVAVDALAAIFAPVPVVGVIEPGAEAACRASTSGPILVLATEGTVKGGAYERAILTRRPAARVLAASCPLFVALAEEGWGEGEIAEMVTQRYLGPVLQQNPTIDCLVLGCTHFPVLRPALARVVAPEVAIVDSAETTATVVSERLSSLSLRSRRDCVRGPQTQLLATDAPERFARVGAVFLGRPIDLREIELVDL